MVLSSGLTAYYTLEGNSTDNSGNSHTGTDTSITYSSGNGKISQGAGFNGSSSYISIPSYTVGASWSISMWIKQSSGDVGEAIARDESAGSRGMSLYCDSSGFALSTFNTSNTNYDTGIYSITHQGNWTHVVAIYEAGVNARIIVNNNTPRTVACTGNSKDTNDITIGRRNYPGSNIYFTGAIDEVGVWNRVLTSTEITELYNSGSGITYPFPSSGTTQDTNFYGAGI